jgi:glyoxylate utilization-related uncharacterized protein
MGPRPGAGISFADISLMERVSFVMKDGVVYKLNGSSWTGASLR